jgi:hypothetical protein
VVKKVRNIILLILAVLILITGITMTILYYYRNEMVALFVEEANKYLETPVEAEKIELELWENFPMVSFKLDEVKIYESADITMEFLCKADNMLISFDIFNIIFKNYEISTLKVSNAQFNIGRGPNGEKNYEFIRYSGKDTTTRKGDLSLPNIILENVQITYLDKQSEVSIYLETDKLNNILKVQGEHLLITLSGNILKNQIDIKNTSYVKDQLIGLESEFTYNLDSQVLHFDHTGIKLNGQQYQLDGHILTGKNKYIDLNITSEKNNVQAIVAVLPQKYRNKLSEYRSKGLITFNGNMNGSFGGEMIPSITADFSCTDVEFYYPGYKNSFKKLNFTGHYTNGPGRDLTSSKLTVKNFSGFIGNNKIEGELSIQNFKDLSTALDMSGNIDLASFLDTFPVKQIQSGDGAIAFDIKLSGRINDLKNKKTNSVKASGDLFLKQISFTTRYNPIKFRKFNGRFYFNNLDLDIQNFTGQIGESDFGISGSFRNIISYLFYRNNPIKIIADLESSNLNMNELLTLNFSESEDSEPPPDSNSKFHLAISPKLDIDFNCVVDRISFKRFNGEKASGKLRIKDQVAVVDNLTLNTMGGDLIMSGSINATVPVKREFLVDGKLSGMHIDSIFYVFHNFNQSFLMSRHLKGQIYADVNAYFLLDDKLKFYSNTLTSFSETRIIGGELIDFEPMQYLSKYLKEEDLAELHFSELNNDIQIIDRKVIIPEMEIISNAYHIYVSGVHTFNQDIDYHFRIPLDQFRRPDRDSRYGEIEENGSGPPNLFLKMQGTATDYEVLFDSKAVKEKIRMDLKEEGNELKDLFKQKKRDEKVVELEEDEYFDF